MTVLVVREMESHDKRHAENPVVRLTSHIKQIQQIHGLVGQAIARQSLLLLSLLMNGGADDGAGASGTLDDEGEVSGGAD